MSYQPIKQPQSTASELTEVDLEGSETDVEANPPGPGDSFSWGWRRRNKLAETWTAQCLKVYKKALQANVPLVVSLHLLVLNLVLSIVLVSLLWKSSGAATPETTSKFAPGELTYTLAQDIIEPRIEIGYFGPGYSTGFKESPYQGWPNDEKDRLWKKYEEGNHIRITPEEAAQLAHPTVHVPLEAHKGDYMVGLAVAHQLHCLSALRRALYPRRYGAALHGADGRVDYAAWHHADHCVETLRAALECRPDTTALSLAWVPGSTVAAVPRAPHTCRGFGALADWVGRRAVDVSPRANLEGGRVVDYTGRPYGREYNETWVLKAPEGWAYTKDDM